MTFKFNQNEYTIVLAGQIYNINTLKAEILTKKHKLESNSDTEILLKAYICFGTKVVTKLNGICSFAIWDKQNKTIFIARDHLGLMPLYYCTVNETFIFSTDLKAILKHSFWRKNLSVVNPSPYQEHNPHFAKTIFKNIYKLAPANSMIYKERYNKI